MDDQRVNLTRFPLFYPERRAFFVERAGTFEVKTGEVDLLFNSRRVGLTPEGEPVRLLGGARLVGQAGGLGRRAASTCRPARHHRARGRTSACCARGGRCSTSAPGPASCSPRG